MENYKYFVNKECEYYPCHKGIKEEDWSCLFCYCPLYLIENCGGNHRDHKGVKDCSQCLLPHQRENWKYITDTLGKEIFSKGKNEEK